MVEELAALINNKRWHIIVAPPSGAMVLETLTDEETANHLRKEGWDIETVVPEGDLHEKRHRLARVLRDWIHETPMTRCNMGADECPDWPLAYELTDRILVTLTGSVTDSGDQDS